MGVLGLGLRSQSLDASYSKPYSKETLRHTIGDHCGLYRRTLESWLGPGV